MHCDLLTKKESASTTSLRCSYTWRLSGRKPRLVLVAQTTLECYHGNVVVGATVHCVLVVSIEDGRPQSPARSQIVRGG